MFVAAVGGVGADPIFLGAEGISGPEHALMGSVSEEALRPENGTAPVVGEGPEDEGPGAGA